jgi:CDAN1-interacting nuclease 1
MMSVDQFEQLYEALKSREDARRLADTGHSGGPSYNALVSIYAQKFQRAMKRTLPAHRARAREYHDLATGGSELLELAERNEIAPCVLARLVLEVHVELNHRTLYAQQQVASKLVTQMLRQPALIHDASLRAQVDDCVRFDDNYSPLVEKLRHSIGTEYEYLLQTRLRNMRIPFLSEDELVASGYPKTPDIKFEVPLLLDGQHVVNWIESKATFGDRDTMAASLTEQFAAYCNRYGTGLVIYWFGFVEPPATAAASGVVFRASLPRRRHWTTMRGQ